MPAKLLRKVYPGHMLKHSVSVLLLLLIISLFQPSMLRGEAQDVPAASSADPSELTVVITSDTHFTAVPAGGAVLNPGAANIALIMEAFADQVIDLHPDALILTGDNTNSGKAEDMSALTAILQRIHAEGIEVIVTTGNHDFNHCSHEEFEASYAGLCEIAARDTASLSFAVVMEDYRFLAMDDNMDTDGVYGIFSSETMQWLRAQLSEARELGQTVIFLSHHNVLPGGEESVYSRYSIRNSDLRDLLAESGVRLCFSGHRHSQEILRYGHLYEVISSMLSSSPHHFGILALQDGHAEYTLQELDLPSWGAAYGIADLPEEEKKASALTLAEILSAQDQSSCTPEEQREVAILFSKFFDYYGEATLALHRDEFLEDPAYEKLVEVIKDSNYGPWMDAMIRTSELPGNRLSLDLKP